jgi:hypothetical protein
MTSTPVVLLLKRSGQSSDRPSGTVVQNGELAIAVGAADPGLYFEDSAGAIRKIGPSHYGTTAPNSSPVGLAGNSVGELWSDSSTSQYYLKVWTGSAWQKIGAAFADSASFATTATAAGTAVLASGAVQASGCILASGALIASGAIIASGTVKSSDIGLSGLPAPTTYGSGALFYQIQSSGIYPAGLYIKVSNSWLAV